MIGSSHSWVSVVLLFARFGSLFLFIGEDLCFGEGLLHSESMLMVLMVRLLEKDVLGDNMTCGLTWL